VSNTVKRFSQMTAMAVILGGILLPAGAASEADHQIRKVWPAHQRSGAGAERESSIVSPNGDFSIHFSVKDTDQIKGGMFWKVDHKGKTVMEDSQLGFTLQDAPSLEAGFEIIGIEQTEHDSTWEPVCGEQAEIRDHYNQLQVTVEDHQSPPRRLILTFRAYDEGAAVQVTFPKQEAFTELTIQSEQTQFRFAGDHLAWTTRHAQGKYETRPLSSLNPKDEYERPFVMKTEDGGYLAILEAGLLDYARMRIGLDKRVPHAVVSRLRGSATITTPYSTPWRVVMAASSPGKLLQRNYLLLNLSPPCKLADASWIKPGKQMRDVTISTAGSKAIVDSADKLGLDYLEIDAGWYGDERDDASDATTVTPNRSSGPFDLPKVLRYAKSKGIGVILYVNRRQLERQLDELLPLYQEWGVAGLKFGFVQVGSQEWTTWLHDSVRKCADYGMVVDAHDEYRMTGIERTFPNFLTCEGIRGNEAGPTPKEDLDTAFLRSLCGPADFTMCWHSPTLKMSWPHQMAASVVYYSPLQTLYWYDQPKMFTRAEPYLAFFRALPTVWDQKEVIQGEIGQYITLARRKGDSWFVGTMNAVKRRQADISLSFLTPGKKYTATIYSDTDPEGATNPKSLSIQTMEVSSETVVHADMANNGGQTIHIIPMAE
jgi:alpha-glucosidase